MTADCLTTTETLETCVAKVYRIDIKSLNTEFNFRPRNFIMDEQITRIINKQLDIKLGPFTKEELDSVFKKLKIRKLQGWTKSPQKCGRLDNSTIYCSGNATQSIVKIG